MFNSTSGFQDITDDGVVTVTVTNLTCSFLFVLLFSICTKWIDYKKGWRSTTRTPLLASDFLRDDMSNTDTPASLISNFSDESEPVSFKKFISEHWSPITWVTKTYRLTSAEVFSLAGFEAVAYLEFLKYIVRYFCVCSVLVMCVLLPLNLSGEQHLSNFRSTTVDNLRWNSPKLWAHLALMCVMSAGAFITVFNFQGWLSTARTQYVQRSQSDVRQRESKWKTQAAKTAVMIENFPQNFLDEKYLLQKLETVYADRVVDVCIPLEITVLIQLEKERKRFQELADRFRAADPMKSESYQRRADKCTKDIEVWKLDKHEGTGTAFVIFKSEEDAAKCIVDHQLGLHASLSTKMQTKQWKVSHAPEPKAIQWENLRMTSTQRFWRRFGFQILVIIVYLAFLVPSLILACVESLSEIPSWRSRIHGLEIVYNWSAEYTGDLADDLMFAFVPVAILVLMHLVGSYVVLITSRMEGYTLRKSEEYANTRKTFLYGLFFSLIIPVAVLGCVRSLVVSKTSPNDYDFMEALGHSFLPNSGAYFINYIITAACLQNSVQLFSLPEIFRRYISKKRYLSSKRYKFLYSTQYAWILVTIGTIMLFSTFVPLIIPCGTFLFGYKFLVDKHNLCFVYRRTTETSGKLLNSGLRYFVAIIVLFQLALTGFLALRKLYYMALVGIIVTVVSILLYLIFSYKKKKYLKKRQSNLAAVSVSRNPSQRGLIYVEHFVGAYHHPYLKKYKMDDYGRGISQDRESIHMDL